MEGRPISLSPYLYHEIQYGADPRDYFGFCAYTAWLKLNLSLGRATLASESHLHSKIGMDVSVFHVRTHAGEQNLKLLRSPVEPLWPREDG